jgi:hypothetical protein
LSRVCARSTSCKADVVLTVHAVALTCLALIVLGLISNKPPSLLDLLSDIVMGCRRWTQIECDELEKVAQGYR